jgi:hypothetical protein
MSNLRQMVLRAGGLGLIALTSACAQTGGLGNVLGGILNGGQPSGTGTGTGDVVAEVQNVDTRNQSIQVRTQNNQTAYVYYDNRTQVVYNNQGYAVTALERGDVVNMRISQTGNNQYYTDYIQVTQSAQQRAGSGTNSGVYNGGVYNGSVNNGAYDRNNPNQQYTLAGSVSKVDYQHGMFTVRDNNGNSTTVAMPNNARSRDANRFQQMRNGDYVQFRAHWWNPNRFELVRFQ